MSHLRQTFHPEFHPYNENENKQTQNKHQEKHKRKLDELLEKSEIVYTFFLFLSVSIMNLLSSCIRMNVSNQLPKD